MPSMKFWTKMFCVTVACCALFACGKNNDAVTSLSSANKHPDTWVFDHRTAYQLNPNSCRECHGEFLNDQMNNGGITRIDCFNQQQLGQCHSNGHGPLYVPHQLPFVDGTVHGPVAKKDLVFCQSCHGMSGGPGSNPRFNVPFVSNVKGKGCESESCHAVNTAHPVWKASTGWKGHATAGNMGNSCYLCHASGGTGPACNLCHTGLPAGTIPTQGACVSCHAKPPVTGNHNVHNALAGITNICAACHSGAGSGTAKHANGTLDTAFDSSYNAKSGAAVKNTDGTCSNVSCHGGVKTPAWGGVRSNGCAFCHTSGTAQFNGYYSGQHDEHVNGQKLACTDCHDMTRSAGTANHFSGLGTPAFELAPSATIRVPNYSATTPSCTPGVTPPAGTYSVGVCHANKSW